VTKTDLEDEDSKEKLTVMMERLKQLSDETPRIDFWHLDIQDIEEDKYTLVLQMLENFGPKDVSLSHIHEFSYLMTLYVLRFILFRIPVVSFV
jgi:hypothetical protein